MLMETSDPGLKVVGERDSAERVDRLPRMVFVELSRHCNLACDMCRPEGNIYRQNQMSDAVFERVADALFAGAERVDLRGWGESLILPNFPQRVDRVKAAGADLRIVSNFSFRVPRAVDALARANAFVSISLDSPDAEVLKTVRKGARLDLILENIRELKRAYATYGSDFSRVYIGATVQERTVDDLHRLIQLAASLGITDVRLFARQNDGVHYQLSEPGRLRLLQQMDVVHRTAAQEGVKVRVGARLWPEMEDEKPAYDFPCLRPWNYVFIGWDGHIGYCDFLMGPDWEKHAVGHILDAPFNELWNGERWRELRRRHLRRTTDDWTVSSECSWCYKNRFVDFEDDFDPSYGPRVISPQDIYRANSR